MPISTPLNPLSVNTEVILDISIPNFSKQLRLILYSFQSPLIKISSAFSPLVFSSVCPICTMASVSVNDYALKVNSIAPFVWRAISLGLFDEIRK